MKFILHSDHYDPGFRFEALVRYAFDCGRDGDPKKIADQRHYGSLFMPEVSPQGLEALEYILDQLLSKEHYTKHEELLSIKKSLTNMSQSTGIELIDYILKVVKE